MFSIALIMAKNTFSFKSFKSKKIKEKLFPYCIFTFQIWQHLQENLTAIESPLVFKNKVWTLPIYCRLVHNVKFVYNVGVIKNNI